MNEMLLLIDENERKAVVVVAEYAAKMGLNIDAVATVRALQEAGFKLLEDDILNGSGDISQPRGLLDDEQFSERRTLKDAAHEIFIAMSEKMDDLPEWINAPKLQTYTHARAGKRFKR